MFYFDIHFFGNGGLYDIVFTFIINAVFSLMLLCILHIYLQFFVCHECTTSHFFLPLVCGNIVGSHKRWIIRFETGKSIFSSDVGCLL